MNSTASANSASLSLLSVASDVFLFFGYSLLAWACFIWWRRSRHWSFVKLTLAFLNLLLLKPLGIFMFTVVLSRTPDDAYPATFDLWSTTVLSLTAIAASLLMIGAFGFLSVTRSQLLLWQETGSRPSNSSQPQPPTLQT